MKIFIFIFLFNVIGYCEYNFAGIRDPMIKSMPKVIKKPIEARKNALIRQKEIYDLIKKCKIEGVVISGKKKLVLINDRLLSEGEKVFPDRNVFVYKIDNKFVQFSLDGEIVTYSLSVSK